MKLSDWITLVCFLIVLVILWQFRQILLVVFASVVLAIALNSLVRRIVNRFRVGRGQAVLITMSWVLVLLILSTVLIFPLFIGQFEQLLKLVPQGFAEFEGWLTQWMADPPRWVPDFLAQEDLPGLSDILRQLTSVGSQFFGNFLTIFSGSINTALQILLFLVLTVMLLSSPHAYRRLLLRLFPSSYRNRADEILSKCESALLCWLGGVSINALFVAILSFVGLVLLGIPYSFANAMLAGLFNFIPNIGPGLSAIFPIIVAMSKSFGSAISVFLLYVVIQNLESYWFSPMMMQRQISLLPAATLIVQLFFAKFFGVLGLILALPLAVVCKTWIEEAWITDVLEKGDLALQNPDAALPDLADALLFEQGETQAQGSDQEGSLITTKGRDTAQ